jgi:hypothetical protein
MTRKTGMKSWPPPWINPRGDVHDLRTENLLAEDQKVKLEELVVSMLAMSESLAKLLIAKAFRPELGADKANYIAMLKRLH